MMSRFTYKSVPKNGTKGRDGTRARDRESGHVPSRFPSRFPLSRVPFGAFNA